MKITLLAAAALPNGEFDTPPFVAGETLSYRGVSYDFSPLNEGEEIEIGRPFSGAVVRENGELVLSIEYLFESSAAEPNQSTLLADYTFNVTDGACPCPIIRKPVAEHNIEMEFIEP